MALIEGVVSGRRAFVHATSEPLKIVQAIASIDNAATGTTQYVVKLAEALAAAGHNVDLIATGRPRETRDTRLRKLIVPATLHSLPCVGRLRFSRAFRSELFRVAEAGAVLHSHGLWLMPNIYPAWAARLHGAPLIVSPHGMLATAALAYSSKRKQVFDLFVQRRALSIARCFHATSFEEAEQIWAYGISAPVAVVPIGIEVPEKPMPTKRDISRKSQTLLFLGRLHPIKGLDKLLAAWQHVAPQRPSWTLRLVGPSHGAYRAELEAQASALGLVRVSFEDGLLGDDKDDALQSSDLLVLPSLSENFGLVVAEALARSVPVISTKGAPWQGLIDERCGWWIDHGVEAMQAALLEATALSSEERKAMGCRGRAWMIRAYSWMHVAAEMQSVYRWCLGLSDRPSCILKPR